MAKIRAVLKRREAQMLVLQLMGEAEMRIRTFRKHAEERDWTNDQWEHWASEAARVAHDNLGMSKRILDSLKGASGDGKG